MAMKNINKFKQWTGEKLGQQAKTEATEEFKELEQEMSMRQEGLEKLYNAAGLYIRALGKKKEGEDREKALPPEILGNAMVNHGGEYAPESAYGQALLRLGNGMERIGRLQEAYVHKATESALDTMERGLVQMKDYQAARRKLESRRLAYDSVLSKVQKMRKEDVRTEEELRSARAKYEETSEDVHNRMTAIQEAEAVKLGDLTEFMESQLEYFKKCTDLLSSIKQTWPTVPRTQLTRSRSRSTAHAHAYTPEDPDPIIDTTPRPVISTKYKSTSPLPHPAHLRRTQTDTTAILPPRPHTNGSKKRKMMRVEYPFDAESDSEMSIVPGEIVAVIEEVDAGWYIGEIVGSEFRNGMFPATYCVVIPGTAEIVAGTPVRRSTGLKPPSPTSTKSDDSLEEQVASLSLRRPVTVPVGRPGMGGRSVSSGSPAPTGKKKAPPPPVSRGNKPVISASSVSSATLTSGDVKCRECGCDEFRANVFKKGSCNNCFHVHVPQ